MKTIIAFILIFIFQFPVCSSQTRRVEKIQYRYCCTSFRIYIGDGFGAHIEGFSFLWLVVYCLFIIFFTAVTYIVPDIVSVYYGDIENSLPKGK